MKNPLLLSILAALSACNSTHHETACLRAEAEGPTCPPGKSVDPGALFLPNSCGGGKEIVDVDSDGTVQTLQHQFGGESDHCCYTVAVTVDESEPECVVGRPYREGSIPVSAPVRSARSSASISPRAAAWERAGAQEHASVAAFARLSLELMALGAPSDLVRDVHRAAIEEVLHAERCWDLARRFGAASIGAGPFPFKAPVAAGVTLAELAADAVREGCLGETLGAHLAAVAAELSPEPEVRVALSRIAAEESDHAVLSYRIVAWAIRVGGDAVLGAVRDAFAAPWPHADVAELALRANVDEATLRQAAANGARDVLEPAMDRLLAA